MGGETCSLPASGCDIRRVVFLPSVSWCSLLIRSGPQTVGDCWLCWGLSPSLLTGQNTHTQMHTHYKCLSFFSARVVPDTGPDVDE